MLLSTTPPVKRSHESVDDACQATTLHTGAHFIRAPLCCTTYICTNSWLQNSILQKTQRTLHLFASDDIHNKELPSTRAIDRPQDTHHSSANWPPRRRSRRFLHGSRPWRLAWQPRLAGETWDPPRPLPKSSKPPLRREPRWRCPPCPRYQPPPHAPRLHKHPECRSPCRPLLPAFVNVLHSLRLGFLQQLCCWLSIECVRLRWLLQAAARFLRLPNFLLRFYGSEGHGEGAGSQSGLAQRAPPPPPRTNIGCGYK